MSAPSNRFDWDDLRFFLAVARTGQLSAAATRLRTGHATVSRRIDRLEFSLKLRLFERNARGYVLTPIGKRFMEAAERAGSVIDDLQDEFADAAAMQIGGVRLMAPEGFSNFFFTEQLAGFTRRYPGITLDLVPIQQIMSLSRREADIAVAVDDYKSDAYVTSSLTEYTLRLYASRAYLAGTEPIRQRADLLSRPFIGYIEDMIFTPGLNYLKEVSPGLKPVFRSSSLMAQLNATLLGVGLCVLPDFIARRHRKLVMVLPEEVELRREYRLLCHRDLLNSWRVRAVMGFLHEIVADNASVFRARAGA